jgi:hypothetical protein
MVRDIACSCELDHFASRDRCAALDAPNCTHAESAAAIFSLIAPCRLHGIDPEQFLDEILRVLPYWPATRYLELAPKLWLATRNKLRADELDASPLLVHRPGGLSSRGTSPHQAALTFKMGLVQRLPQNSRVVRSSARKRERCSS